MSGIVKGIDSSGDGRPLRVTQVGSTAHGRMEIAGYESASNASRVSEVDPVSDHHVEETLAEVTNGTDGTYYYYVDMDGYRDLGLQLVLSGGSGTVTVTVEATLQDDGTAPASCSYVDVSNEWFGAASWTADALLINTSNVNLIAKYARVKVVAATSGANDADWTIFAKRVF